MLSNHLILCRSLLFPSSVFPSIRVFASETVLLIRWPEYWSFSFSISPSNEYSGLIPLGCTGCISLQSKGLWRVFSNTTVQKHEFYRAQLSLESQLSHLYMTTGKTIAFTRWTFYGKVMSVLFNMLSRLVITFLPRSKRLSIPWLQSPSAEILEPPEIKSATVSTVYPSICREAMGLDAMVLVFWMLSFKPNFSLSSIHMNAYMHIYICRYICIWILLFLYIYRERDTINCHFYLMDLQICNLRIRKYIPVAKQTFY